MSGADTSSSPVLSEAFLEDSLAVVERLREEDPVHFVADLGFWLVTRYDDVRDLFTHPDFSNDPRAWDHYVAPPEGSFQARIADTSLFAVPPEVHARQRRLASAALTPRAVRRMEAQVREVVGRFAEPLRGRTGVVDLVGEFTDPIPNTVISLVTGVQPMGDDELRFRELAQDMIRGFFAFAQEEARERGHKASEELAAYFHGMIQERRREPRADLVTDMVLARDQDDRLSDDEIVMMIGALISAGSETTAIGGCFALRTLLRHPNELEKLRAEPSLLDNAVSEVLRYDFAVGAGVRRFALRDTELRGRKIRKGQMVQLNMQAAHRDPRVFPDPHRFDITRDCRDILVFGRGPHFCLGSNLARQELRCMVEAALDFLPPEAHIREDEARWQRIAFFNRMETLPVDFGS